MIRRRLRLAAIVVAALLPTAACGLVGGPATNTLTAHFDRAVGLYKNSDVRILGVKIGQVTSIVPEGRTVKVTMRYDRSYKIPADAEAVIIAPSIVSDRYVQLTPVWRTGPTLPDGVDIGVSRTAIPVELDQIYAALDSLNQALGPNGVNKNGALSDLIATGAKNLKGNGALLNGTLRDLSLAVGTLADHRSDLFGTITGLAQFSSTLAASDGTVRTFNADLADVAGQLAAERTDLATAVRSLAVALGEVSTFVKQNKADLTANVKDLASVTNVLVKQQKSLAEFLDNAPTALSNLQLAYNPRSGTLDTRDNNGSTLTPQGALCSLLMTLGQPKSLCLQLGAPLTAGSAPSSATGRDLTLGGILGSSR